MAKPLSAVELTDLVGRPIEAGPQEECEWPEAQVAEGGTLGNIVAFALAMNVGLLDAAGLRARLAERGSAIEVASAGGEALSAWSGRENIYKPSSGKVIRADLSADTLVVLAPNGTYLQFWKDEDKLRLERLDPRIDIDTIVQPGQLHDWIQKCSDQWLASFVASYVGESTEPTRLLIGAGRLCRLESDRPTASDLPSWKGEQVTSVVLAWADQLSRDQVRTIDAAVANSVDRLTSFFDDLTSRSGPDGEGASDPVWQAEFLEFCHARDDIEGMLTLRDRSADSPCPTEISLENLDDRAIELVTVTGDALIPSDDARLLRVSAGGQSAWWLAPVLATR